MDHVRLQELGFRQNKFVPHFLPTNHHWMRLPNLRKLIHRSLEPNHVKAPLMRTSLHAHRPKSFDHNRLFGPSTSFSSCDLAARLLASLTQPVTMRFVLSNPRNSKDTEPRGVVRLILCLPRFGAFLEMCEEFATSASITTLSFPAPSLCPSLVQSLLCA